MIKRLRRNEFTPQLTGYKTTHSELNHGTYMHSTTKDDKDLLIQELSIPHDKIAIKNKIGEGAFGVVLKATLSTEEGLKDVALKAVKSDVDEDDAKSVIFDELKLMRKIGCHGNVIALLGVCSIEGPLYIITEYLPGGTLLQFLRRSRSTQGKSHAELSEHEVLRLALGVCEGMEHLTTCEIIHGDLSARNVLLDQNRVPKLADFGLSRDYKDSKLLDAKSKGPQGKLPIKWMSIESLRHGLFTRKSDVWSFGVVMWEIITLGGSPYPGIPTRHVLNRLSAGYRMDKPEHCSAGYYDIMKECWEAEPQRRISFDEISQKLRDLLECPDREYFIKIENLVNFYPFMDLSLGSRYTLESNGCSS